MSHLRRCPALVPVRPTRPRLRLSSPMRKKKKLMTSMVPPAAAMTTTATTTAKKAKAKKKEEKRSTATTAKRRNPHGHQSHKWPLTSKVTECSSALRSYAIATTTPRSMPSCAFWPSDPTRNGKTRARTTTNWEFIDTRTTVKRWTRRSIPFRKLSADTPMKSPLKYGARAPKLDSKSELRKYLNLSTTASEKEATKKYKEHNYCR